MSNIDTELKIVRKLVRTMRAAGFEPVTVHDGGERVPATTERAVLDVVASVDESTIRFSNGTERGAVFIVLGNAEDCIADYSYREAGAFEPLVETVQDWINATFFPS